MRGFIQPWLFLLLVQKLCHGYELMERLTQDEEAPDADPGLLYCTLRKLEEEGLVHSSWNTEGRPGGWTASWPNTKLIFKQTHR